MAYFNKFPYIEYQFPNNTNKVYKNISIRPAIVDALRGDYTNLQIYYVEDGETPETIAYDVYNDQSMNWIIMLANDILNIYTDWPMSESTLESYLYEKYRVQKDSDGVERTLTDSQVYEFINFVGTTTNNYSSEINLHDSDNSPKVKIRPHHFLTENGELFSIDSFSINVDAHGRTIEKPTMTPVSYYQYERELNDEKRKINVPTPEIANRMQRELGNLVNE